MSYGDFYRDLAVLVTGGLGFIGSNLAIRLAALGARVTVADAAVPGCGANDYNLEPVRGRVQVLRADIGEPASLRSVIASSRVVFNLAGEISHVHSMEFPERDLDINARAHLRFLRECAECNRGVRVVYASTRQVYGIPVYLPVDEHHPLRPVDYNGIHKHVATMYHEMLTRSGDLDAITLKLTNVYGPRMAIDLPCQGFLSTFLRRLLTGEGLDVFGDGEQLRDPCFVDDVVEAFLLAGAAREPKHRTFNVGGPDALSLRRLAEIASRAAGLGEPRLRPFPAERLVYDIGSYATDSSRIREEFGWTARVGFEEGIAATLAYYRERLPEYLRSSEGECSFPGHREVMAARKAGKQ